MASRRRKTRGWSRAKAKKTKYLSLTRHLIKAEVGTLPQSPAPWEEAEVKQEEGGDAGGQQQLEPFALHHEASTLFLASPAPSLTDILGASAGGNESPSASPDDVSGRARFPGAEEEDLARRALRGRERWVYCSSSSSPTTTTTTTSPSPCSSAASTGASARSLLLKLDYEEILAAWAERGSLYIGGGGDCHATPEPELDNVLVEVEPSQHATAASAARPGRAERVRRYKEKRRSRLFAKRIRYEVRRVNAVKRPRFKGRFIKENGESELQPA
ncbi:uncharacterized protein LOC133899541 isoform X2 [Phragmites australis]|uniref:uncharacterized protein LOC133899541 isoform X2 n=1 Tax=Phragmites australis TaxID=29695 RepID=UPI002D76616D|nr:uncharacterized protein LOC133899541 isoform X2 [Phragmites australis]